MITREPTDMGFYPAFLELPTTRSSSTSTSTSWSRLSISVFMFCKWKSLTAPTRYKINCTTLNGNPFIRPNIWEHFPTNPVYFWGAVPYLNIQHRSPWAQTSTWLRPLYLWHSGCVPHTCNIVGATNFLSAPLVVWIMSYPHQLVVRIISYRHHL